MKKNEMKSIKGGFNPDFSINEELEATAVYPWVPPGCDPPPNISHDCLKPLQLTVECHIVR